MTRFVDIHLHGPLAEKYGGTHKFAINSPREAVAALEANYPGFRRDFLANQTYGLLVDGDWRDEGNTHDVANAPVSRELDLVPMVEGRLQAALIPIVGAIIGAGTAANIIAGVIAIGLLIGVSMLLAPKAAKKTTSDAATSQDNYMFSGPENVTEQGAAVPLIYGTCFVGSVVVSAGLEVAEGVGGSGNSWSWSRVSAFSEEDRAEPRRLERPAPVTIETTYIPPGPSGPPYRPENA